MEFKMKLLQNIIKNTGILKLKYQDISRDYDTKHLMAEITLKKKYDEYIKDFTLSDTLVELIFNYFKNYDVKINGTSFTVKEF